MFKALGSNPGTAPHPQLKEYSELNFEKLSTSSQGNFVKVWAMQTDFMKLSSDINVSIDQCFSTCRLPKALGKHRHLHYDL